MLPKVKLNFLFFSIFAFSLVIFCYFILNKPNSFAQTAFPCGTVTTPPPVITNPTSGEVKIGAINFSICDTNPAAVPVEFFLSVPPSSPFCRNLFGTLSKPAYPPKDYTSPTWDSTQVSDGTYWLNVKERYPGMSSDYWANVQFIIKNGFSGTLCQTPDKPTVNIKANDSDGPITIEYNTSAFIKWTSTNASNCTVLPTSWTGKSGGQSTGNLQASKTYTVNCFGPGGNNDDSVTVNVSPETTSSTGDSQQQTTTQTSSSINPTSTSSGETIISPETVTAETLASSDKLVIEEEIPVSITEFDPDIFLKGNNIKLTSIKNVKQDNKNFIYFEGKTKPNTLVTLYIFSNPIIVTLKSDSNGNWNYEREKRIETGKHSAFATIYDENVTRRSDVTSFFVAKNSSGNLVLKQTTFENLFFYGLILGGVVAFGIVTLIMYRIYISKKVQKV